MIAPAVFVAEARTWLGTPYHHHARIKGVGVDCIQIIAACYEACGGDPAVLGDYAQGWHKHRNEELYLQGLEARGAVRVTEPQPGDIGVWRFGRTYSHGGILVDAGADPLIVHAYTGMGVIATRASEAPLAGRSVIFWRLPDVG